MFSKQVFITAGKIDLTNHFENNASANDEKMQSVSGAFVNSAAFAVPLPSPGVRVRTTVLRRVYLQLGLANTRNSGSDLFDEIYNVGGIGIKLLRL
jgi:high affinity Mn2+ porin